MAFSFAVVLVFLSFFSSAFNAAGRVHTGKLNPNASVIAGIEFPGCSISNAVPASPTSGCGFPASLETGSTEEDEDENAGARRKPPLKLQLNHRSSGRRIRRPDSVTESKTRDRARIQALHTRKGRKKKNENTILGPIEDGKRSWPARKLSSTGFSGHLTATLGSGVPLGSGEYLIDVFVGTPPKHFSLILDTGSDLNWIQCLPCHDCFEQSGPFYDPNESSSYRKISCQDRRCNLVSSPNPPKPCTAENQSCPYFYWYGDSSNTTGDFAVETFTVNLTEASGGEKFRAVENVMFGCGHWNRGLFHGAAGLLGFGRGPLSFPSQLQSIYGSSFSYCLVDRNSNSSVSSKLIFGENKDLLNHPHLNFTSLVGRKENPNDTFYYLLIKSILLGGEILKIPETTWELSKEGEGGTIIDSGTTLSYFAEPAYKTIKEAFMKKVKDYSIVKDVLILDPCYNVSGVEKLDFPSFEIVFGDGGVWSFPLDNYMIWLEPGEVICLAILGTPRSAMSIIGNYQQQNFLILYDTENSRLGFTPRRCADV